VLCARLWWGAHSTPPTFSLEFRGCAFKRWKGKEGEKREERRNDERGGEVKEVGLYQFTFLSMPLICTTEWAKKRNVETHLLCGGICNNHVAANC